MGREAGVPSTRLPKGCRDGARSNLLAGVCVEFLTSVGNKTTVEGEGRG